MNPERLKLQNELPFFVWKMTQIQRKEEFMSPLLTAMLPILSRLREEDVSEQAV